MLHDFYKSVQQGTLGDFAKKYASSNSPLVKKAQSMSRTSKEDKNDRGNHSNGCLLQKAFGRETSRLLKTKPWKI